MSLKVRYQDTEKQRIYEENVLFTIGFTIVIIAAYIRHAVSNEFFVGRVLIDLAFITPTALYCIGISTSAITRMLTPEGQNQYKNSAFLMVLSIAFLMVAFFLFFLNGINMTALKAVVCLLNFSLFTVLSGLIILIFVLYDELKCRRIYKK